MCEYCEKEKPIISKTINEATTDWGGELREYETEYIIFIRGNYLCIGDKEDCNCVDATTHEYINFCPICSRRLTLL